MSAQVHRLTGAGPMIGPEKSVIDMLKMLLKEAESGEIKAFGFFMVDGAECIATGWAAGCARESSMIAGSAKLQHRIVAKSLED